MQKFSYTRLSKEYLLTLLQDNYTGLNTARCHYFTKGLHDNYLIECDSQRIMCRVYRNDWRTEDEIGFELEYLKHLATSNSPVTSPIPDRSGGLFFSEGCPEGVRFIALFHYAPGLPLQSAIDTETARMLGKTVAKVHQNSKGFQSIYKRKALKLPFLLSDSVTAILPYLKAAEDIEYLQQIAQKLEQKLQPIESSLPQVICQGDVNPTNFHITADKQITLFDFDQCGIGARVFEIAKFQASIHFLENSQAITEAFIDGYEQLASALSQQEREVLPFYQAVAVIWVMAIRPSNAEWIGHQLLQYDFWQHRLSMLRSMTAINR